MASYGPRIASFDGGGRRAFAQLIMMKRFMHQLRWKMYPNEPNRPMRPCDYFDLMAGSDTGGLIVILLVKLRMVIEEAIEEFGAIVDNVYAKGIEPEDRTGRLRLYTTDLLDRKGYDHDLRLEEPNNDKCCLGFVMATASLHVADKVRLRTYYAQRDPPTGITVVEAALATCAYPQEFLPVTIGTTYDKCVYTGAGVGANNPVRHALDEAGHIFRNASIETLLSFGSGHPGILALDQESDDLGLYNLMREMMIDCEKEAMETHSQVHGFGYYFRFSVVQGLQKIECRAEGLEWIKAQADAYSNLDETRANIEKCVDRMTPEIDSKRQTQGVAIPGQMLNQRVLADWMLAGLARMWLDVEYWQA